MSDNEVAPLETAFGVDHHVSRAEAPERPAPPPWPEAPATEPGTAPEQTWPDTPRTRQAEEPTRPAISPAAPRPTYPWQKKPRPESTT